MSVKRSNMEFYRAIYEAICQNPGITASGLRRVLRIPHVESRLVGLERMGLLLCEDDEGGLYPFNPASPPDAS